MTVKQSQQLLFKKRRKLCVWCQQHHLARATMTTPKESLCAAFQYNLWNIVFRKLKHHVMQKNSEICFLALAIHFSSFTLHLSAVEFSISRFPKLYSREWRWLCWVVKACSKLYSAWKNLKIENLCLSGGSITAVGVSQQPWA